MVKGQLSIVIPSFQRSDLLALCLERVTRHAPAGTETIVVDDGSRHSVISSTAQSFPGVSVIRMERRGGFCVAANRGLREARGEFIELLNDDTQVEAGWAETALRCFDDPAVGAVTPLVLAGEPGDAPIIDSAGDSYDAGGFAWKNGHGQRLAEPYLTSRDVAAASGSTVFFRRSALVETGLFAEHFGSYFEDVDLSLRLRAAGWRIRYEPAARVWHRGGASHGRPARRLIERQSCNEERLFWRQFGRERKSSSLIRHLAVLSGKAIRRCREGNFFPFIMGRIRAIAEFSFKFRVSSFKHSALIFKC